MNIYAIGDSFTNPGYGASSAAHGYLPTLARLFNASVVNLGVSGGAVPDLTANFCSVLIAPGDQSIVELGTNDHWFYGGDSTKLGYYRAGIQSCIAWLALVNKQLGKNNPNASGSWVPTPSFGIGKMSSAAGDMITYQVYGTVVYIGYIRFAGMPGSFDLKIDGVDYGHFITNGNGITTYQQMPCGQQLIRVAGLSPGIHTIQLSTTDSTNGNHVYSEWCAGNDQSAFPPVYVANLTRLTAAAYANSPHGISDATLALYNAALASVVGDLQADGLNIHLIDNNAICWPEVDTYLDGLHPNDSGHAKIGMNIWRAMAP